jgi:pectin methylesterase-like acyl-CoA thioesterase
MMTWLARIAGFLACVWFVSDVLPLSGDKVPLHVVVVATDGSGDFRSVQAAIDASGADGAVIRIRPGIYEEKIVVEKPGIQLRGLGHDPRDVVLTWHLSSGTAGGTSKSASTAVTGDDFYAENLTFENSFSRSRPLTTGSQAVALRVTGDRAVFRHVRFLGFQDTLYASTLGCMGGQDTCRPARQYFADCYIEGNVDFIFGDSLAFFEGCEIHSLPHHVVAITAQSKHRPEEKSGYVFDHCRITAEPGAEKVYLGRPWRGYASVVFLDTYLGPEVAPEGWLEWEHDGKTSLPTSFYAEFNSSGPGANPAARDSHAVQLSQSQASQFRAKRFLAGEDGWDPTGIH